MIKYAIPNDKMQWMGSERLCLSDFMKKKDFSFDKDVSSIYLSDNCVFLISLRSKSCSNVQRNEDCSLALPLEPKLERSQKHSNEFHISPRNVTWEDESIQLWFI